jgi:glycosyltransferase involved in cell wall biosynthesis
MRILCLSQVGNIGGANTMLTNIVFSLLQHDVEVTVVMPEGDACPVLEGRGVKVVNPPWRVPQFLHISGFNKPALHPRFLLDCYWLYRTRAKLQKWILERQPDLVVFNAVTLSPYMVGLRRSGLRVVCLVQETAVRGMFGFRLAYLKALLRSHADQVVCISNFDAKEWGGLAHFAVVPNWVDLNQFSPDRNRGVATRTNLGIPISTRVVLYLGGISELKGIHVALRAINLAAKQTDVMLVVAGFVPCPANQKSSFPKLAMFWMRRMMGRDFPHSIRELLRNPGLLSRVKFVGNWADVRPLYDMADVLIFPAIKAHQSRPLIEAGAMRVPCIMSDFINNDEFTGRGTCARLIPSGDHRALANAISKTFEDPNKTRAIVSENHRRVHKFHSSQKCERLITNILLDPEGKLHKTV